tara:strand:+ start:416 stop:1609 length:1194 start_codon:yes stop_codon:yes gene_type:complete
MPKKEENIFLAQEAEFEITVNTIYEHAKIKKIKTSDIYSLNANFIYLLAIFDRFIGNYNKYLISTKSPIKKKYIEIFEGVCKEKIRTQRKETADSREALSYFNKPTKMIRNYSYLEKELKSGPFNILKELITEYLNVDKHYKLSIKYYKEARQRRNLLVHRGRRPDKIYYDLLKINNIDREFQKKVFKDIYSKSTQFSDLDRSQKNFLDFLDNDKDAPIDLSITPRYLQNIILHILELKEIVKMDINDKKVELSLHHRIKSGVKHNDMNLILSCHNLYARHIKNNYENKLFNLDIADKVNFIICREILLNKKIIKRHKKNINNHLRLIDSIKDNEDELAKFIKPLLKSYVNKNKKEFYKNTRKIIKENKKLSPDRNIKGWLLFHKYRRLNDFKKIIE